jgi:hypothetical protein
VAAQSAPVLLQRSSNRRFVNIESGAIVAPLSFFGFVIVAKPAV